MTEPWRSESSQAGNSAARDMALVVAAALPLEGYPECEQETVNLVEAALEQHTASLRSQLQRLEQERDAYQALAAVRGTLIKCYRLSREPEGEVWRAMAKAKQKLASLGIKEVKGGFR